MVKALLLLIGLAAASLAPAPAVDASSDRQGPRDAGRRPGRWASPMIRGGRQWSSARNRGPRRASAEKFAFPSEDANGLQNSIANFAPWGWSGSGNQIEGSPCDNEKGTSSHTEFGYGQTNGPDTWVKNFPSCGGSRQSPININLKAAKLPPDGVDDALFFKYYDAPPIQLRVENSGHSLKMTGNWSAVRRPRVTGFVLSGDYALAEVHFHWGADDEEGSEHLVLGDCFPLEMHAVHYKLAYGSVDEARKRNDGLAVIGYLFKIHGQRNPGLQKLIDASKQVIDPASPGVSISAFTLDKLAPPFTRNYASYQGSLTTPPCSEIVTWIVNLEPQAVSSDQLAKLRKLRSNDGTKMLFNFRPVQALNGREIKFVP